MLRLLLLDLDNTLYSETVGMERDISERMTGFVARHLGLEHGKAAALRKLGMGPYGTTLEWLMAEHGFRDPDAWFAAVHPEGEEEVIDFNPALRGLLESIALPKVIFTNSPIEHAERILAKLGIADLFREVYDIRFNQLRGKPHLEAVNRVLAHSGTSPGEGLLVDDLPKYLRGFVEAGGHGALLDERDRYSAEPFQRIRSLHELPALIARIDSGAAAGIAPGGPAP